MSRNKYTLDKNKRYSTIRGPSNRKFQQDGRYFDHYGNYLGDNPDRVKEVQAPVVPEAARLTPAQERKDALTAAAAKLNAGGPPKEVVDAAKENAQALAAEDQA